MCVCAKSLQLCPTLLTSLLYGILQTRMLKWVAMPSSRGSCQPNPEFEPTSPIAPALQVDSWLLSHQGSPLNHWRLEPNMVFPHSSVDKQSACNAGDQGSIPGSGRSLEKEMATIPVFLPGESPGQKSLVGYSPWCHNSWTRLSD